MPKTAGTSLRVALSRRHGARALVQDYGPGKQTSEAIRALQGPPPRYGALRETVEAPGGILLLGHTPAERYWESFNADAFVAFLRDPVARMLSEWNHHVTHDGLTEDLESYAARPHRRNQMTRMLGPHWRRFGFLGLTERYAEALPLLSAHLGIPLAEERRNTGRYPEGMAGGAIPAETAARIAAWNEADMALHAAVTACWAQHGRWVPDPPPGPPRLDVKEVRPGVWRGVCADAECARTWVVSIRQGGVEVARRWADRYLPRLRERQGLRTGIGQFVVEAERLGIAAPPAGPPLTFAALDPLAGPPTAEG